MAGVDVGGGGKKRGIDADINLVPFIDLLLVTVAFLLITAVWTTHSRINANAQIPGDPGVDPPPPQKTLHVDVKHDTFVLSWRDGSVVTSELSIERNPADPTYGALRERIAIEYESGGVHTNVDDLETDRVILHTANDLPFKDVVAVMDAVASTKREIRNGGQVAMVPAFTTSFAIR